MSRAGRMLEALPSPRAVAGRILRQTGLCRAFVVRTDLYRLRFFPTARSCAIWTDPGSRKRDELFFRRCLRLGDTVVDVGANVGALTLTAAALVGRGGRVWSIEAEPRTFRYLTENVALNRFTNVCAIHAVAGAETGVLRLRDGSRDEWDPESGEVGVEVPVRRLDDLVPDVPVRVLRIAGDGCALSVLGGAERLLLHTEYLYFDHGRARDGDDLREVSRRLGAAGFAMFEVWNGALRPFTLPKGDRRNLVGLREGEVVNPSPSFRAGGSYRRDEAC